MPKLDEGALWVRATMPYTISFEESRKIVPEIRQVLRSFSPVTVVASEHGRPDDGTDPTGFFNAEFFVGLKPYGQWHGEYHTKPQLIAAIDRKLAAFPGIIFNYTQPAEDAVDEAETGLKSALEVKVFGTDLQLLEDKGKQIKHILAARARHRPRDPGPGARPAEPDDPDRSGRDRPLRRERRRRQRPDRSGGGRRGRDRGGRRGEALRSGRPPGAAIPKRPGGDRQHPGRHPRRPAGTAQGARPDQHRERRLVHLPPERSALHRRAVLGRRTRPRLRGRGRAAPGERAGPAPGRVPHRLGRRVRRSIPPRGVSSGSSCRSPCS